MVAEGVGSAGTVDVALDAAKTGNLLEAAESGVPLDAAESGELQDVEETGELLVEEISIDGMCGVY